MGFLDKVKDVAGKAADQAKHATAVGKEKIEDAKLQRQIDKLVEEIGALVVKQRRGEGAPETDAEIDAKVAAITDLERQIEENAVVKPEGDGAGATEATAEPESETPAEATET